MTTMAVMTNVTVHLVGVPTAAKFGLSVRARITPKSVFAGKERPVVYLYASCDNAVPTLTTGVPVAVVTLDVLNAGDTTQTFINTATGEALMPLAGVTCAKLAVSAKTVANHRLLYARMSNKRCRARCRRAAHRSTSIVRWWS